MSEVRDGLRTEPQSHGPFCVCAGLDIVDDQRRLWVLVDVESRPIAMHLDPDFCPLSRDEIDIGLVLVGRLFPKLVPLPVPIGHVMIRVIYELLLGLSYD